MKTLPPQTYKASSIQLDGITLWVAQRNDSPIIKPHQADVPPRIGRMVLAPDCLIQQATSEEILRYSKSTA